MSDRFRMEQPVALPVPLGEQARSFVHAVPHILRAGILSLKSPSDLANWARCYARWGFSVGTFLNTAAHYCPRRTAIIDDMGEISYAELHRQALSLAAALQSRGVEQGSQVAIIARNSRITPMTLAACTYLGAVPMIINPGSSAQQISRTIMDYGAAVVIADAEFIPTLDVPGLPIIVGYGDAEGLDAVSYQAALAQAPAPRLQFRPTPGPTVIMSSGTTGTPKGVVRGVPKSPAVAASLLPKIPWRREGVIQMTCSTYHAWGWLNVNLTFATKSTTILRRVFDPQQAVEDCLRYGVTGILSAAVFLREFDKALEALPEEKQRQLRPPEFIASSGNAIPPTLIQALHARFGPVVCNFYGSTEHGPVASASGPELTVDPTRAGTVAPGVRIALYKEDGSLAAPGEKGIIYSANSESMIGYLSKRDGVDVRDHMLSTGDYGHFDAQGFLHVHGRCDDMVIKGGENVYPREVEDFLLRQEGIADVFVRGVRNDIIARLDAYIVREESEAGRGLSADTVRNLVRSHLAQHNIPDFICWMDSLPRNDAGKVVPRKLPQPSES
ncbi:AMP-binding protein [Corynebacterium lowii]|uniref:Long-chain-fatty-acid--CoA ligase FadD13 n=1 Tax=Corynebacterium lowii TaxID=1544413 RepID=A0A0Q0U1V9_9CORY|nr:AMP-binding protein [Corynebacterium lowii]KQB85781.1 Long-chain-fatty-acid--CoA ligase FadD13 [Corynebacterium lowii]MDP9851083.1 fatty-acyl-CoA synthase [Corynebacterium lowii]